MRPSARGDCHDRGMANLITVVTPDGETKKHGRESNSDDIQVRHLAGGGFEVLRVHQTGDVSSWGREVSRPGTYSETVLGTYAAGSTYTSR